MLYTYTDFMFAPLQINFIYLQTLCPNKCHSLCTWQTWSSVSTQIKRIPLAEVANPHQNIIYINKLQQIAICKSCGGQNIGLDLDPTGQSNVDVMVTAEGLTTNLVFLTHHSQQDESNTHHDNLNNTNTQHTAKKLEHHQNSHSNPRVLLFYKL